MHCQLYFILPFGQTELPQPQQMCLIFNKLIRGYIQQMGYWEQLCIHKKDVEIQ